MLIWLDFISYIIGVFTNIYHKLFEQPSIFDLNNQSCYVILNIICMYLKGVGSPTSNISQRSFQSDVKIPATIEPKSIKSTETCAYQGNDFRIKKSRDSVGTSSLSFNNRPDTSQGNIRSSGLRSPPPKFTISECPEGEFVIGDLGESFRNWEETTRSEAIMSRIAARFITQLLPPCCF